MLLKVFSPSVLNIPARGLADAGEFVYSRTMNYSFSQLPVSVAVTLRLLLP